MAKGDETRATILDAAVDVARLEGIDALSIGRLAAGVGLSKSGLFAHFKSKKALQLKVLERAAEAFRRVVVFPALREARGTPRIRGMFENWLAWAGDHHKPGGCVFIGAAAELDDKPGELRDYLRGAQHDWLATLATACKIAQREGHIRADADPEQFAFETYGIMMSFHLYRRLLDDAEADNRARAAFDRLLESIAI